MALGPGPEKATHMPVAADRPEPETDWHQAQARRYMEARYGTAVWYKAPELFGVFEQWLYAMASGNHEFAETRMTEIENHFKEGGI